MVVACAKVEFVLITFQKKISETFCRPPGVQKLKEFITESLSNYETTVRSTTHCHVTLFKPMRDDKTRKNGQLYDNV